MKNEKDSAKRFLKLENGKVVETSEDIYTEYWRHMNHQHYLERIESENTASVFSDNDLNGLRSDVDVEQITETALLIALLRESLGSLSGEERNIINELFFCSEDERPNLRELGEKLGISHTAVRKKYKKILSKLHKEILDKLQ